MNEGGGAGAPLGRLSSRQQRGGVRTPGGDSTATGSIVLPRRGPGCAQRARGPGAHGIGVRTPVAAPGWPRASKAVLTSVCVCVGEPCKRVKVGGGVKASKMHLPPAQQRRGDGAQPPGEGRRPRGRTPRRGSVWDPRGRARGAEVSPRPPPPACGAFSPAPWSSGEIQTHP